MTVLVIGYCLLWSGSLALMFFLLPPEIRKLITKRFEDLLGDDSYKLKKGGTLEKGVRIRKTSKDGYKDLEIFWFIRRR